MFKVGNKVRRINSGFGRFSVGDVDIVERVTKGGLYFNGDDRFYDPDSFDLVEEDKPVVVGNPFIKHIPAQTKIERSPSISIGHHDLLFYSNTEGTVTLRGPSHGSVLTANELRQAATKINLLADALDIIKKETKT